jgi:hypothetical protein
MLASVAQRRDCQVADHPGQEPQQARSGFQPVSLDVVGSWQELRDLGV